MAPTPSSVRLLLVPYDLGQPEVGMGASPLALGHAGHELLRQHGHLVEERRLDPESTWRAEVQTAFELHRVIAAEVRAAHSAGQVPILLSGNCNTTVGALAGVSDQCRVGLVWFDAHGDFNTPDIDPYGFLDGQGLAMCVGRCWQTLTSTVPGFIPVPEARVLLVGARSFDAAEESHLRASQITWLPPAQAKDPVAMRAAIDRLAADTDLVHIHVDLDVHDPSIAPANSYAAPDGLSALEVQDIVREVAGCLPIGSATLSCYDPSFDPDRRMRQAALDLLTLLVGLATTEPLTCGLHGRPVSETVDAP